MSRHSDKIQDGPGSRRPSKRRASRRNIKLTLEYDGSGYCGWQVQNSPEPESSGKQKKSVQETIEKALRKILHKKTRLIASGRTDAGVHALGQVANFSTDSSIPVDNLLRALNALLPEDIAVNKAEEAGPDFHARFSARSKIYRYVVLSSDNRAAIFRNNAFFYPYALDIKLMRKELKCLIGRHDFKSFCASGSSSKSSIRTIKRISIREFRYQPSAISYNFLTFDIEADGFLYNMVRNIIGTLLDIGRGRFAPGELKRMLSAKDRRRSGPTAPARGLYLIRVKY